MAPAPKTIVSKTVPKKTTEELTESIVHYIIGDINSRSGVGAIWRQLNVSRKAEMLKTWKHNVEKLLRRSDGRII